jgi:ribonuclease G
MSKEFIVSSTRHETRVAILEDDQVVEIYYQREKEYTLAGSIHKGRVTRVLPGMQSAFVDIGLDRDAFLYVSDFFEDNDEYDKIVSGVEDSVLRLEKGESAPAPASIPVPHRAETDSASLAVAPVQAHPPMATGPVNGQGPPAAQGGQRDARGKGRRSRRRRSPQSGLPDSKFYSPRGEERSGAVGAQPQTQPEPFEETQYEEPEAAADVVVLPGESLAKYSAGSRRSSEDRMEEPATQGSTESITNFAEADDAPVHEQLAPEPVGQHVPAEVAAHAEERAAEAPAPVEAAHHMAEQPEPATGHTPEAVSEASAAATEELELAEDVEPEEIEVAEEAETSEELKAAGDVIPDVAPDAEGGDPTELSEDSDADDELPTVEGESPEPARIPQSLTATLREQGPRLQHRVSRRMRRRGRGGERGERGERPERAEQQPVVDGAAAAPPAGEESGVEVKTAPRQQGRPERQERQERPERTTEPRAEKPERVERPMPQITDLLRSGQEIIVQIAKEPLGQKGARITSHIALPGRFLVYMPTVDHVGVSRKIPSDEERQRLKRILQSNRAGIPGGYIVRTAGEGHTEEELRADMMFLYNLWMDMRQRAEKKPAPALLHHDLDVVQRILRDQLTSAFKTVWVDNEEVYESVLSFVQRFQPTLVNRVKLYTRSAPIFDEFGITAELEKALRPKVWLKSGGYIVINQTEALVAIDINTGKYVGKSNRLEDTIVKINSDAIKEIVRQIRLRDLGGIIVVDFIDMDERKNRQKVMQTLEEAMRVDRAPYKILQFNDFGLVAITRKRVKQSLERTLCAPCPYCEGAGSIKSVATVIGEILLEAQKLAKVVEGSDVMLRVNPEVAKVLKSNQNDHIQEIEEILGRTVMVKTDPLLHQTKFDLA